MIPKSRVLTMSADPLERLRTEIKDITKIQPLALRGEITTWQYDAKNCIALHYRMVDSNVWSRGLFEAIKKWAARLLTYASALGFGEEYPGTITKGRPGLLQSYWYLTHELRRIRLLSWSDQDVHNFHRERKVDISVFKTQGNRYATCALCHDALSGYDFAVRYRCTIGGVTRTSEFVGESSLQYLISKINKAVKKHRNPEYREVILEKMRSKNYGDGKLRPGYRKA